MYHLENAIVIYSFLPYPVTTPTLLINNIRIEHFIHQVQVAKSAPSQVATTQTPVTGTSLQPQTAQSGSSASVTKATVAKATVTKAITTQAFSTTRCEAPPVVIVVRWQSAQAARRSHTSEPSTTWSCQLTA